MTRSPADRWIAWTVVAFLVISFGMHIQMSVMLVPHGRPAVIVAIVVLGMMSAAVGLVLLCFAAFLAWRVLQANPKNTVIWYLRALRFPIGIVVANIAVAIAFQEFWPDLAYNAKFWPDLAHNAVRLVAFAFAGWTLARRGSSIWKSALAGLLLLLLDHVLIKGGWFLLNFEWDAFGGVLISFGMYAFVPLAVAALAGLVGRRMPPSNLTVEADAHEAARGSP